MDAKVPDDSFTTLKFGVGQPVRRNEDFALLRGQGTYTDDPRLEGTLFARVVRSAHAHGTINAIDTNDARAMPGVVAIYTGDDLPYEGVSSGVPYKSANGEPMRAVPQPPLARGKVVYPGQPVAFVVAETAGASRDAADAVFVDIDALPAVTTAAAAMADGAPQLHGEAMPGNVALDFAFGPMQEVEAALAGAHHVTKLDVLSNRIVVNAMEPRAVQAAYDPAAKRWTIHSPSQGTFGLSNALAGVLGVERAAIRVLSVNVGGSFGMKASVYPEIVCAAHAARDLGRPVRWADERSESFLSDCQGRDTLITAELGLDKGGKFLALRLLGTGNIGAYPVSFGPHVGSLGIIKNVIGPYATPLAASRTQIVCTNTTPIGPYRGAGRPEGNYVMERLVEAAARDMDIDPIELRRRNLIPASAMPYTTPTDNTYDSGDFAGLLDEALEKADWAGFESRKAEAKGRGMLLGRGLSLFLEATAGASNEQADIRFEADGTIGVYTGTHDQGQGHRTVFAQVLAERLGVPFDAIRIIQTDSDELGAGGGTGGSKSIMASGTAIVGASEKVIEKGRRHAGHVLEAAEGDIDFEIVPGEGGRFSVAGTDLGIGIMELAARLREGTVPADDDGEAASLDALHLIDPHAATFPNGCHIAEVEIDPATGVAEVVRYTMVNDFGVIVNPLIVEAQAHGGVVQGIGQALMERVVHDEQGQVLTGSFMDYAVPHARGLPMFTIDDRPTPATTNPLGVKGCGEAGCAGALPSVMHAVIDALSEFGVTDLDMPATPEKVWRAIHGA